MWYVYLYLREDRTPYYVGKGSGRRCFVKHNVEVPPKDKIVIIKNFSDEDESYEYEEWLIRLYGMEKDGGILENKTIGKGKKKSFLRTEEEYKERRREIMNKYYNSEKGREKIKEIRENYKERRNKLEREYRKNNLEKVREYQRDYRDKNKEKQREYMREYYQRNKLKFKQK